MTKVIHGSISPFLSGWASLPPTKCWWHTRSLNFTRYSRLVLCTCQALIISLANYISEIWGCHLKEDPVSIYGKSLRKSKCLDQKFRSLLLPWLRKLSANCGLYHPWSKSPLLNGPFKNNDCFSCSLFRITGVNFLDYLSPKVRV